MRRLKLADEQLTSGTASADSFSDSTDQLVHAAEIVACFGELLVQPEFVDWDDSDYKVHAEKMKEHALEVRTAISEGNYDGARNSAKAISQSCSACHADYR
jgi:cytochrome c556